MKLPEAFRPVDYQVQITPWNDYEIIDLTTNRIVLFGIDSAKEAERIAFAMTMAGSHTDSDRIKFFYDIALYGKR